MKKVKDRSQIQTQLFTYLMNHPRWRRQLKLIIKLTVKYPTIRYRQRHTSQSATKSTLDKVNYSRCKSKSDNNEVRRKSQSTINEESRHSTKETDNQRSTYIDKVRRSQIDLLIYCRQQQHQHSRWPTISNDKYNNRRLSAVQKLYTPKARTAINRQMKVQGDRMPDIP